jgi:hypothetical protein
VARRVILLGVVAGCAFHPGGGPGDEREAGIEHDAAACSLTCPLGCDPSGQRCLELVPSNAIDPAWVGSGTVPLNATSDLVIDTELGTITAAGVPLSGIVFHPIAAVDCGNAKPIGIGVFSFTTITISDGVTVHAIGSRALAVVASGPIEIDGLLDVAGGTTCTDPPRCAGAGGFAGGLYDAFNPQAGDGPGGGGHGYSANGPGDESGGGGGAGCGNGGAGGDALAMVYVGGAGGSPYQAASLEPLCGGSGGGAGGPASYTGDPGERGGGGGGAVQLVSAVSVTIGSTSAAASGVTAGGAGGQGDKAQTIDDGGGGGGGGGAILIEAPQITVAAGAVLAANGGGGAGGYNSGAIANDGVAGLLSAAVALGGTGLRPGGSGGAGATVRGEDAPGPIGDGGAGGGGGTGRIRLNSRTGTCTIAGVVSPSLGACATQGMVQTR